MFNKPWYYYFLSYIPNKTDYGINFQMNNQSWFCLFEENIEYTFFKNKYDYFLIIKQNNILNILYSNDFSLDINDYSECLDTDILFRNSNKLLFVFLLIIRSSQFLIIRNKILIEIFNNYIFKIILFLVGFKIIRSINGINLQRINI